MRSKDKVTAIVLAAGQGKRMKSDVPKQYMCIEGKPVLYYTLKAFEASEVDEIILVTGADEMGWCREQFAEGYAFGKIRQIVAGGAQRYDSVYEGLKAAVDSDYVLIHDGARPLITPDIINKNIDCVREKKACVTAVRSKDTVKIGDGEGFIRFTPARSDVWIIQTPQSFEYTLVRSAYDARAAAMDDLVTDDAMVVEKYSDRRIYLLEGEYTNIKITTPEDMVLAKEFLNL